MIVMYSIYDSPRGNAQNSAARTTSEIIDVFFSDMLKVKFFNILVLTLANMPNFSKRQSSRSIHYYFKLQVSLARRIFRKQLFSLSLTKDLSFCTKWQDNDSKIWLWCNIYTHEGKTRGTRDERIKNLRHMKNSLVSDVLAVTKAHDSETRWKEKYLNG